MCSASRGEFENFIRITEVNFTTFYGLSIRPRPHHKSTLSTSSVGVISKANVLAINHISAQIKVLKKIKIKNQEKKHYHCEINHWLLLSK